MLLQGILQGELNCSYILNNIDTKEGLNFQLQVCLTEKGKSRAAPLIQKSYQKKLFLIP